jgi:hypothetical protein
MGNATSSAPRSFGAESSFSTDANPILPGPDELLPEWRMGPYFDSADEPRPTSDLLSRPPKDTEPRGCVCPCGARVLQCWASDPEGPSGSRLTYFDLKPVETGGRWFMSADGSLSWDPTHGTYRLHDCSRPAAQPSADTLFEAVA